jgi:hypothetical protein
VSHKFENSLSENSEKEILAEVIVENRLSNNGPRNKVLQSVFVDDDLTVEFLIFVIGKHMIRMIRDAAILVDVESEMERRSTNVSTLKCSHTFERNLFGVYVP